MSINLSVKFGQGIQPRQFMESMNKNKDDFEKKYELFQWSIDEDKAFFQSFKYRDDIRCLIIASDWCGDVVKNVPVVFRILEETGIPVDVLIMEEHTDVIDQFLTMGGRAIPKVIFTDTGGHVLCDWGPRPDHVQEIMRAFKQENPDRDAPDYREKILLIRKDMVAAYGETEYFDVIVSELRELLTGV